MSARSFLFLLALLLSACGSSTLNYDSLQPTIDATGPDTPVDLAATFAGLDRHLDPRSPRRAPLSEARIAQLESELRCPLPPLLRKVYSWRNGAENFIPGYDWLPLEQLVAEAKRLHAEADTDPYIGWIREYLPVMMLDGSEHLLVGCTDDGRHTIVRYFIQNSEPTIKYRGVGHWLATTLAAYDNGAYRYDGRYLEESPILVARAFERHALDSERKAAAANWRRVEMALRNSTGVHLQLLLRDMSLLADERAVPILRTRLATANAEDAAYVAYVLGELRARDALPELGALLRDTSPVVRNAAAYGIAKLGPDLPDATVDVLLALLHDTDDLVKLSAIEALGNSGSSRATEPLVRLLPTSRRGIQFSIVESLGRLGGDSAVAALRQLQADLADADMSERSKGGTRGADLTRGQLKAAVDRTLEGMGG